MPDPQLPFNPPTLADRVAELIVIYGYPEVDREVRRQIPTMIIGSAPARPTDPETSHMAAKKEQDVGRFTERSKKAKLLYLYSTGNFTQQQAAVRIVGAHAAISAIEGTRRRVGDLVACRFVYDAGKRAKNQGSDDDAIVWGISEAGREALILLDDTGWSRP
jgi:hypothetical protein